MGGRRRHGSGAWVLAVSSLLLAACNATTTSSPRASDIAPVGSPSLVASAAASQSQVVGDGEEWVVYQWMAGSGDGIFLVRPDGTGGHQLVADMAGSEIHPDWSPDGQRIAFVVINPADRHELWVVGADGAGAQMLYSCDLPCNTIDYPDWAADGNAIYYGLSADAPAGAPPSTFGVGRLDLATGEASVVLTREDGMTAEQPRISPDGMRVAYTRFRDIETADTGSAIFVSDLVGGPETKLTDFELFGAHPDWSVNDVIVFNTYDLGAFQDTTKPANLYVVAPDGSGVKQLTTFGDHDTRATQPRWAPDGSAIVFTRVDGGGFGTRRTGYIRADGTDLQFLLPEAISATHAQLRPLTGK
jgi:Tol biopolymer transport system component